MVSRLPTTLLTLLASSVLASAAYAEPATSSKPDEKIVEASPTATGTLVANTTPDQTKNDEAERSHRIALRLGGIAFGTYPPRGVGTNVGIGGGLVFGVSTHLDVEVSAFYVSSSDDSRVPMQVLVRRPFFVSRVVRPYVGAGARMSHIFGAGSSNRFGFTTAMGTYFWFADHVGAFAEANAAAAFKDSKAIPEVGATAGIALGF